MTTFPQLDVDILKSEQYPAVIRPFILLKMVIIETVARQQEWRTDKYLTTR